MTVSTTTNKVSYTGNGSTDTFAYAFPIYATADLNVFVDGTKKTLTTHYTVTGAGGSSGGNVVFTTGNVPANTKKVVIERVLARTQSTDWNNYDKFTSETVETAVDRLTYISQEQDEETSRAIKFATTVTDVGTVEVSGDASTRANKVFHFDASGNLSTTNEIGVWTGNWAASTTYAVRDLVKDSSNSNVYICITAHSSSGSAPISSNTDAAKWALLVDAASAATSATNAASSASSALTHKNAAETAKTAAETAQTASETAKTASETAKTAAETAKTAAEASYDSFDDRYLGAKSTSGGMPSTDNDGNALIDGAVFFDTTNNVWMVYNLGTTTWLRTTPTTTDQGHINTVSGIQANVTTVAGISANTTTVAGISGNVTTVAGISSDVTAVAGDATDIGTVAGKATEIGRLGTADAVSDMNMLGTTTNVNNISTVAGAITNVNNVGGSIANVNTTAGSIANVNTVATNISDVNAFGNIYRISASAPSSSLDEGDLWWDSTSDALKVRTSSAWYDPVGTATTQATNSSASATAAANSATSAASHASTFSGLGHYADWGDLTAAGSPTDYGNLT